MNCTEFNDCLDDGVDQQLGAAGQVVFDAHRASCVACQATHTAELAMLERLRAMPVMEPVAGFEDRVLANAYKSAIRQNVPQQQNHHRRGFVMGFGSAAAAALAMWVVVGMPPGELPEADRATSGQIVASANTSNNTSNEIMAQQPVLSIALNTEQTVRLAFASSESLTGAKITIRLPENVALAGYPGQRQLSWETNLKKGDNLLSLPIIATQVARGELIADIEYEGRLKTLKLNLETGAETAPATSSTDSIFHQLIG